MYICAKTDQGRCSELDRGSAKVGYKIRKPVLFYHEKHLTVYFEIYTIFIELSEVGYCSLGRNLKAFKPN